MRFLKLLFLIFSILFFANSAFAVEHNTKKTSAPSPTTMAGKYKSGGPIEITSDSLDVLQQEHKAIFTGHVIAVQGDVHLKSEKMTVFYKSTTSTTANPAVTEKSTEKSPTTAVSEKNSIEKIVVEKNIFLTTPEETASGASGIYDVVNHKIFLNGNVVLTRDTNVLKGDRLVYNFATGKSELNSPKAGESSSASQPKQRVKALFIPNNDKELPLKK